MIVQIVIGDWSGDGHEQTDTRLIETNLTTEAIKLAYKRGVEICSVDITKFCTDYNNSQIPIDVLVKLHQYNIINNDSYVELITKREFDRVYITPGIYLQVWLNIVKLGSKIFEYQKIEGIINVGGYGLFNNE